VISCGQAIEKGLLGGELLARIEGRLTEARAALRRVLARRQITLGKDDDARIDACGNLATLERWLDQAVTSTSASEALK
jgi:hypothetical protein